jgi:hypothetical protein
VADAAPAVAFGLLGRDRQHLAATALRYEARGAKVDVAAIDVIEAAAIESWRGDFDAGIAAGREPDAPGMRSR